MELTSNTIYFLNIVDRLHGWTAALAIIMCAVFFICLINRLTITGDGQVKRWVVIFNLFLFLTFLGGAVFVPSKRAVIEMYIIPKIVNSKTVQGLDENLSDIIDATIRRWLPDDEELNPPPKRRTR